MGLLATAALCPTSLIGAAKRGFLYFGEPGDESQDAFEALSRLLVRQRRTFYFVC